MFFTYLYHLNRNRLQFISHTYKLGSNYRSYLKIDSWSHRIEIFDKFMLQRTKTKVNGCLGTPVISDRFLISNHQLPPRKVCVYVICLLGLNVCKDIQFSGVRRRCNLKLS